MSYSLATLSDRALIVVTARVDYRTVHGKEPQPLPRADINCTRLAMKLIVAAKDARCEASELSLQVTIQGHLPVAAAKRSTNAGDTSWRTVKVFCRWTGVAGAESKP